MEGIAIFFGIFVFVVLGTIIGSFYQLALIRQLEQSSGISDWANDTDANTLRLGLVKPELISWSPRITIFHNFLSEEECDYLREIAKPRLKASFVLDTKTGKGVKSDVRTSYGMFLDLEDQQHPIVQAIQKRIVVFTQVPNGELIQILRYERNQFYIPHRDYFSEEYATKYGEQRIATILMYLNDNVKGGETYFPMAGNGACTCGRKIVKGISVKPVKGNAVLFWNMGFDGKPDPKSVHGGCDVLEGEKWSATQWLKHNTYLESE